MLFGTLQYGRIFAQVSASLTEIRRFDFGAYGYTYNDRPWRMEWNRIVQMTTITLDIR